MSVPFSISRYVALYRDRRLLTVFLLGIISGFPWVLIGSAMTAWLQESGLTRSAIGFFGSIFVVYAFNFLWAPLLDSVRVPFLSRLGRRKSWIVLMQILLFCLVLGIAFSDPKTSIILTSGLAFGIALVSATQDTAVDAYRIEIMKEQEVEKIPAAAAMATSGWWAGYSVPGALALILSDQPSISWQDIYFYLSGFILICIVVVTRIKEPPVDKIVSNIDAPVGVLEWLSRIAVVPLMEFFRRNGMALALGLLSFIFLFKLGEAFLGRMSIVFYKEVGFSNSEIGVYSKLVGWWAIIIFSLIASAISIRFGLVKGLFISGVAMAASNFMFSWIALVGPVPSLFAATVIVDQFTTAFSTVAFVSFISSLTNRAYTATQYALMASLGNLGRTTLAVFSGVLIDGLGGNWALFFAITAFMVIPSLLVLMLIRSKVS